MIGAASAANPIDGSFGDKGVAEIEAFVESRDDYDQVGGIVDLERGPDGKLLAAVYGIARGGHLFAVARIGPDGSLDKSFGDAGFTRPIGLSGRHELSVGGLQAEAVAQAPDGDLVLAGYLEREGALAPALARFTESGHLVKGFGRGGSAIPHPSYAGKRIGFGETGGEVLHDVAVEPDGTIVAVGHLEAGRKSDFHAPKRPGAVVVAYRPDGRVDRSFADRGRLQISVRPGSTPTTFSQVKALPSGKLLVSGYVKGQLVLYRLTAQGRPDPTFGGGDGVVRIGRPAAEYEVGFDRAPFAVGPGGRIVIAGATAENLKGYEEDFDVTVGLLPDGRRDPRFRDNIFIERAHVDADEPIPRKHVPTYAFSMQGLAIDGHGRIVVTGSELAPYTRGQKEAGYEYFAARRFLPNGRLDRHFGHGGVWATNPPGSESLARAAVTERNGQVVGGGWVQIERGGGNGPGNTALLLTRYR